MTTPKASSTGALEKNGFPAVTDGFDAEASRQGTGQEVDRLPSKDAAPENSSSLIDALRPGAVECMAEILTVLRKLPKDRIRKIVREIGELGGQGGIRLGDLDARYECDHIDGLFSGQQMFCMLHCGMKLINPNVNPPSGLDREYELARKMAGQ